MTEQERQAALTNLEAIEYMLEKFVDETDESHWAKEAALLRKATFDNIRVFIESAALSSPRVPMEVEFGSKYEDWIIHLEKGYNPDFYTITRKDKSPALPKIQKVDLDGMKWGLEENTYNRAIDDIKSKYGELYAEVK